MAAPPDRLRRPPGWLLTVAVLGAVGLLWGLSGWSWTVPALALGVALAVALVARVIGVLLPREGRWIADRAGVLAGAGALAFLVSQSSAWAVLLALGVLAILLALPQGRPARRLIGTAGAVLALVGAAGVVVQGIAERADSAAAYQAAGDITRAQLLPDTPEDALIALMNAVTRPDDAGCYLFTDAGRDALTAAYSAPDCPAALRTAGASVDDPDAYARRVDRASLDVQLDPAGQRAVVDGCAVRWRPDLDELLNGRRASTPDPGPTLARITAVPLYNGAGWAIDDMERCSSQ